MTRDERGRLDMNEIIDKRRKQCGTTRFEKRDEHIGTRR
jgi:hypothetical protein